MSPLRMSCGSCGSRSENECKVCQAKLCNQHAIQHMKDTKHDQFSFGNSPQIQCYACGNTHLLGLAQFVSNRTAQVLCENRCTKVKKLDGFWAEQPKTYREHAAELLFNGGLFVLDEESAGEQTKLKDQNNKQHITHITNKEPSDIVIQLPEDEIKIEIQQINEKQQIAETDFTTLVVLGLAEKMREAEIIQLVGGTPIQIRQQKLVRFVTFATVTETETVWKAHGSQDTYELGKLSIIKLPSYYSLVCDKKIDNNDEIIEQITKMKLEDDEQNKLWNNIIQIALKLLNETTLSKTQYQIVSNCVIQTLKAINKNLSKQKLSLSDQPQKFDESLNDSNQRGLDIIKATQMLNGFQQALNQCDIDQEIKIFQFGNLGYPLPIYCLRAQFLQDNKSHFCTIESATGSGKTILVPQFLLQRKDVQYVFVTQPNMILADQIIETTKKCLAHANIITSSYIPNIPDNVRKMLIICPPMRIAKHLERFPLLISKSRFVLDEFHQRKISADVLFAQLLRNKSSFTHSFSFIMMSATPDDQIVKKLPNPEILKIEDSKPYDVKQIIEYADNIDDVGTVLPANLAVNYIFEARRREKPLGNILIFTSGIQNCRSIEQLIINKLQNQNFNILSMKGIIESCGVDIEDVSKQDVFEKLKIIANQKEISILPICLAGFAHEIEKTVATTSFTGLIRQKIIKVIIANSIAETSITLTDLVAVIDSGLFKEVIWNPSRGVKSIEEKFISEAQRQQRIGRVGRVCNGFAYLIQLKNKQEQMKKRQTPEIERSDLTHTILELKDANIDIIKLFPHLPSEPNLEYFNYCVQQLKSMQALNDQNNITNLGRTLLKYQNLNPLQAYLTESLKQMNIDPNTKQQYFIIAAVMNFITDNNLYFQDDNQLFKDNFCIESDMVTLIKSFFTLAAQDDFQNNKQMQKMCRNYSINFKIYRQICNDMVHTYQILSNAATDHLTKISEQMRQEALTIFKLAEHNLLRIIDDILQFNFILLERLEPNLSFQNQSTLISVAGVWNRARYLFQSNNIKFEGALYEDSMVHVFNRIGSRGFEAHKYMYFFDQSFNESIHLQTARIMHRINKQDNFLMCKTAKIEKFAFNLPCTNKLLSLWFKDNQFLVPLYNSAKIKQQTEYDDYFNTCFVPNTETDTISYCMKYKIQKFEEFSIENDIQDIINVSKLCPTSVITFIKQQHDMAFCEFKLSTQQVISVQIHQTQQLFAYSFNKYFLGLLMKKKLDDAKIMLSFDLFNKSIKDINVQCSIGNSVFHYAKGRLQSNLVIVLKKQFSYDQQPYIFQPFVQQVNFKPLNWYSKQSEQEESSDILKIQDLCPPHMSACRSHLEIIMMSCDSQISCQYENEKIDKFMTNYVESVKKKSYQQLKDVYNNQIEQFTSLIKDCKLQDEIDQYNDVIQQLKIKIQKISDSEQQQFVGIKLKIGLAQMWQQYFQEFENSLLSNHICLQNICGTIAKNDQQNILQQMIRAVSQQLHLQNEKVIRGSYNNGLISLIIPVVDAYKRQQILQAMQQFYHFKVVSISDIFQLDFDKEKLNQQLIQKIADKAGYFVVTNQDKSHDKQGFYLIRHMQALHAFVTQYMSECAQDEVEIPPNLISRPLLEQQLVQQYIRQLLDVNPQTAALTLASNKLSGNISIANHFISQLRDLYNKNTLQIPIQQVKTGAASQFQLQRIQKQNKNLIVSFEHHSIFYPTGTSKDIISKIQQQLNIKSEDIDIESFQTCEQCAPCQASIAIASDGKVQCRQFCPDCIADYLNSQKTEGSFYKIWFNPEKQQVTLGQIMLSFLLSSERLRSETLVMMQRTVELAVNRGDEFCPGCQKRIEAKIDQTRKFLRNCVECNLSSCLKCQIWHKPSEQCVIIPKCPNCKTAIEKVSGCNHMQCSCGYHFCWLCALKGEAKPYQSARMCMDHLNSVHGGYM